MWAYPYNFFGDVPYANITLAYDLTFGELGPTVNVSEVMDTTSGILCYTYE
jgi:tyrosinase